MEKRARLEVEGPPPRLMPAPAGQILQFLGRAWEHPGPDGHRPAPLELEPERVHLAVVVEAHAGTPAPLDDEQERALLPSCAAGPREECGPECDDEPHQAREHLVHLREVHRLSGREGGGQVTWIARAIDTAIRDDLEWEPASGQR
jgi:hypothetical protein